MEPLRIAGVGAGYFAAFHVAAWLAEPGAELVGLADAEPGRARALLDAHGGTHVPDFTDAAAMLDAVAPDVVDIAAPPAAHAGLIRAALARRPRAVICQKPFCGGLPEARVATEEAEAAGVPLVVHENFRFQPWWRAMRREMEAGRIGEPYQVAFRLRPGDGQGPDAYLARQPYFQRMERFLIHETAVHLVDVFRFLLGEPASVIADLRRLNPAIAGEDAGLFLLRYADGRRALFDGNRLADHAAEDTRLTMGEALAEGSKGAIELDGRGRLWLRTRGATRREALGGYAIAPGFGGGCVAALQAHVVRHLAEGAPLENAARDYLANLRIEAAIYQAAATGCAAAL